MKAYMGRGVITPLTLTLDLEVNDQYHTPVAFPQANNLGTHCTADCMGPGDGLHGFGEKHIEFHEICDRVR